MRKKYKLKKRGVSSWFGEKKYQLGHGALE
jgi:hypothetical protein